MNAVSQSHGLPKLLIVLGLWVDTQSKNYAALQQAGSQHQHQQHPVQDCAGANHRVSSGDWNADAASVSERILSFASHFLVVDYCGLSDIVDHYIHGDLIDEEILLWRSANMFNGSPTGQCEKEGFMPNFVPDMTRKMRLRMVVCNTYLG